MGVPGISPKQTYDQVVEFISRDFSRDSDEIRTTTSLIGAWPAIQPSANVSIMQEFTSRVSRAFGISPEIVYQTGSGFQDVVGLAAVMHEKRTL